MRLKGTVPGLFNHRPCCFPVPAFLGIVEAYDATAPQSQVVSAIRSGLQNGGMVLGLGRFDNQQSSWQVNGLLQLLAVSKQAWAAPRACYNNESRECDNTARLPHRQVESATMTATPHPTTDSTVIRSERYRVHFDSAQQAALCARVAGANRYV